MQKKTKILITGAGGYIGSCLHAYLREKFTIYALDKNNLNPWIKVKENKFFKCNLLNIRKLKKIVEKIKPDIVIHLAAQSTVSSKIDKKKYYLNNVIATKNLLNAMKISKINNIIFSSTAAVYKNKKQPIKESDKLFPKNNYGRSKLFAEKIIKKENLNFIILRFFNVSSAILKPLIGEYHKPETHIIPRSIEKAMKNKKIVINGKNYSTPDGTCIRDYIHIKDICRAILLSIKKINTKKKIRYTLNLGNEKGISNKEIAENIATMLRKNRNFILYSKRRPGDPEYLVCDTALARKKIKWEVNNISIRKIINDQLVWSNYLKRKKLI